MACQTFIRILERNSLAMIMINKLDAHKAESKVSVSSWKQNYFKEMTKTDLQNWLKLTCRLKRNGVGSRAIVAITHWVYIILTNLLYNLTLPFAP